MDSIPTELLDKILHAHGAKHEGLVHLWTEVRHVSRDMMYSVEQFFVSRILPHTTIWLSAESYIYGDQRHGHRRGIFPPGCCDPVIRTQADDQFVFTGFSEDRHEAIFSPEALLTGSTMRKLKALEEDNALRKMLVKPCHIVQIRDKVNDIYLPNLNVNSEESSLRFDWRAMFSLFFSEAKKNLFACRKWVEHAEWERLSDGFQECEEYLMFDTYPSSECLRVQFAYMVATAREAERHIRRSRIGRLHLNLLNKPLLTNAEYYENEHIALQRIDDHRYLIAKANPTAGRPTISLSDSHCCSLSLDI